MKKKITIKKSIKKVEGLMFEAAITADKMDLYRRILKGANAFVFTGDSLDNFRVQEVSDNLELVYAKVVYFCTGRDILDALKSVESNRGKQQTVDALALKINNKRKAFEIKLKKIDEHNKMLERKEKIEERKKAPVRNDEYTADGVCQKFTRDNYKKDYNNGLYGMHLAKYIRKTKKGNRWVDVKWAGTEFRVAGSFVDYWTMPQSELVGQAAFISFTCNGLLASKVQEDVKSSKIVISCRNRYVKATKEKAAINEYSWVYAKGVTVDNCFGDIDKTYQDKVDEAYAINGGNADPQAVRALNKKLKNAQYERAISCIERWCKKAPGRDQRALIVEWESPNKRTEFSKKRWNMIRNAIIHGCRVMLISKYGRHIINSVANIADRRIESNAVKPVDVSRKYYWNPKTSKIEYNPEGTAKDYVRDYIGGSIFKSEKATLNKALKDVNHIIQTLNVVYDRADEAMSPILALAIQDSKEWKLDKQTEDKINSELFEEFTADDIAEANSLGCFITSKDHRDMMVRSIENNSWYNVYDMYRIPQVIESSIDKWGDYRYEDQESKNRKSDKADKQYSYNQVNLEKEFGPKYREKAGMEWITNSDYKYKKSIEKSIDEIVDDTQVYMAYEAYKFFEANGGAKVWADNPEELCPHCGLRIVGYYCQHCADVRGEFVANPTGRYTDSECLTAYENRGFEDKWGNTQFISPEWDVEDESWTAYEEAAIDTL